MKKSSELNAENTQATTESRIEPRYDCIKLGIDWHARQYRVARIIDNAAPEPAQKFSPADFLSWAKKQLGLAKEVHSCYEAGAGGFVLHRQLAAIGVKNMVVAPRKLDPDRRGVQNDKTDARDLVNDLDRFVRGNNKALRPVFVPTPEQEQRRYQGRLREELKNARLAMAARGRSLLLSQGWIESNNWWKPQRWMKLERNLSEWIKESLENLRKTHRDPE